MMMLLQPMKTKRNGLLVCLLYSVIFLPLGMAIDVITFFEAPPVFSRSTFATFGFRVGDGTGLYLCANCSITCKLDNYSSSNCNSREVSYTGLRDGNHTFEACINGYQGVRCASYYWTVDTVSPTAYVSAQTSFTNALNVSVHISFSEPCPGGGGFRCSSIECNLLVYGAGHVLPSTFKILQPELEFSLFVSISADIQYGRLLLVMDKNICTDAAGNKFTRTSNSSFILHFDRRNVLANLQTHIPEKQFNLNGAMRTAEATNNNKKLRITLSFSEPVLNSSAEVLDVIHSSTGLLVPTNRSSLGNRRFGYMVDNISSLAIVTISCKTTSIISRQGTAVSPSDPVTFLYDTQRPTVMMTTTSKMRTREQTISVSIKFVKPVFGFNSSALLISGGHLLSFRSHSMNVYTTEIHADDSIVTVEIPENAAADIAGNKNLASNRLQVRHYSVPFLSSLVSTIATVTFLATSMFAALLAITTASLLCSGALSKPTSFPISEPSRNLLRIASHIQIFALSKWLVATLPIEYFEFVRGIDWSIPYLSLPWETDSDTLTKDSSISFLTYLQKLERSNLSSSIGKPEMDASVYGTPLRPKEYNLFLENQNMKPEAEYIMFPQSPNWWTYFGRNMFWLAVIGGGLMVLHAAILLILKLRKKNSDKEERFGALVFPRFEIFLAFLALPCICQASATIVRGGSTAGIVVGVVLLSLSASLMLSLFLFLAIGITTGKILQYKEVHQEGQAFHWYQEIIRVTLGPGKKGQWTWKDKTDSCYLTKTGPLFEDLRGPPKYMLSQISGGGSHDKRGDKIIDSDDETEDAEAPFIQKLFGILRIYYTLLESLKRVSLGIFAGAYSTSGTSKVPTIVVLSITSFQLFFLILKKPFIKKKVQFVEIISVACEVGIFGSCVVLLEENLSDVGAKRTGFFMLILFIVGFTVQMINEWYALYRQVVRLSPAKDSFFSGLKTVLTGLLLILLPGKLLPNLTEKLSSIPQEGESGPSVSPGDQMHRSSGTSDKLWLRRLRELAKSSFGIDEGGVPSDPSSSTNRRREFWSGKRSGSSSVTSSSDFQAKGDLKTKSKGLYKDLEAIFSSK